MDANSIGDRLKEIQISKSENKENVKEPVEDEVPKILNPGVRDVFHIFTNMLDIKSFMKLALTSKDMYKRCMEDKGIKISVDMKSISVLRRNCSVEFVSSFYNRHGDDFVAALRKLPCNVNLRTLEIHDLFEPEVSVVSKVHRYMKEIGVNKIHELSLNHDLQEWETVFEIIKDFDVNAVYIYCRIKEDVLRSILQLNLEKFSYHQEVPVDFILEMDTSIPEILFPAVRNISKNEFMNILTKIQSGSLRRLSVNWNAVNWNEFHSLPLDHEGPLPDERPLLFKETTYHPNEYDDYDVNHDIRLLHWHGGVTKCLVEIFLEIFKCDPWEYPWILRTEEEILKDLLEKRPEVFCTADQFRTFCKSFIMIDPSHQGPLPEARPLFFESSEHHFWLLGEDDNLMECTWEDDLATWTPYSPCFFKHPALTKYMFWKVLEQMKDSTFELFYCKEVQEFDSWFADFNPLPWDYSGPLPSTRPLVFERASPSWELCDIVDKLYVVLLDDRLLQCHLRWQCVNIEPCHCLNRPPILYTAKNVVEMLNGPIDEDVQLNLDYETLLDGLSQFKKSLLVLQKRLLIAEKTSTEFWYKLNGVVRKVLFHGTGNPRFVRVSISEGDLRGSPPHFMKQVFRYLSGTVIMELEEFNSCLEQFTVVPFDYSGPLTSDSSLAFVKKEIRHVCSLEDECHCSEAFVAWLLWDGKRVSNCSWGENKQKEVRFGTKNVGVPPALKSKEYLKLLLQAKYEESSRFEWFGSAEDFTDYLEDYMKLPFDYEGPLPEERPLLFEKERKDSSSQFLLRSDGAIIQCTLRCSKVEFSLSSSRDYHVPCALKNII